MNDTHPTPGNGELPDPLMDVGAVCAHLALGERTLRRWISCGAFPKPDVRLAGRLLRWRASTIQNWIESQCVKP